MALKLIKPIIRRKGVGPDQIRLDATHSVRNEKNLSS